MTRQPRDTHSKPKRGRPKSAATLERERQKHELEAILARAIKCEGKEMVSLKELEASLEESERRFLANYKSPPFPKWLVYKGLGVDPDPALEGLPENLEALRALQAQVGKNDREIDDSLDQGRAAAKEKKIERIRSFRDTNRALLDRIGTRGFSTRQVAARVLKEWIYVPPNRRLREECPSLTKRGDGKPPPKAETLRQSWIPRARKLPD